MEYLEILGGISALLLILLAMFGCIIAPIAGFIWTTENVDRLPARLVLYCASILVGLMLLSLLIYILRIIST